MFFHFPNQRVKTIAGLSTSSPGLGTAKLVIFKFQLKFFDRKGFRLILSLNLFSFLSRPITTGNKEEKKVKNHEKILVWVNNVPTIIIFVFEISA
jgi:hypothetical protein